MTSLPDNQSEFISEHFTKLDLTNSQIDHKEFDNCIFKDCNFSDAIFEHCKFIECEFNSCNLSLVKLKYSKFMDVSFTECKLVGVDWTVATWPSMKVPATIEFNKCVLNDSSFYGLYLAEIKLVDCRAHDVDFREGNFKEADFSSTDFTHSLFSSSNLYGANFEYAENYFIDLNSTNISKAKFSRSEAVALLESLDIELLD